MKKSKIHIIEVGPRDGLQNIQKFIPTEIKKDFINLIIESGVKELEVTSFVSPKAIPQLSDAEKLMSILEYKEDVIYSCLVPTLKGLERAINSGVKKVVFFVGASNEFNKKNLNADIDQTISNFKEMKKICDEIDISVKGSISTSFYCPYTGYVSPEKVLKVIDLLFEIGIKELIICDTV
jgi:hydroxymethylglutaryl-CoA lyase